MAIANLPSQKVKWCTIGTHYNVRTLQAIILWKCSDLVFWLLTKYLKIFFHTYHLLHSIHQMKYILPLYIFFTLISVFIILVICSWSWYFEYTLINMNAFSAQWLLSLETESVTHVQILDEADFGSFCAKAIEKRQDSISSSSSYK